jgi:ABC-type bacteriocin/lantibiotic exporter with double-glycine peptidase domain
MKNEVLNQKSWRLLQYYLHLAKPEWKAFALYGVLFTVLNLLIPFAIQLIVNNLALVGLEASLATALIIILVTFFFSMFFRYSQIMIMEYLERQWMDEFVPLFVQRHDLSFVQKAYFFEITNVQKNLSKWALDGFEITLTLVVGVIVLMFYHPYFLVISLLIALSLVQLIRLGKKGVATAYDESSYKYKVYEHLNHTYDHHIDEKLSQFFEARNKHFAVITSQIRFLMSVQILGHMAILVLGVYLFTIGELSLGQFVAAEIITSGIFSSVMKLHKFMESHYGLLVSLLKLEGVKEPHGPAEVTHE